MNKQLKNLFVYVGSYTEESEAGLHLYSFDTEKRALAPIESYSELANPSFLAVDTGRRKLFAVSETKEYKGTNGGSVASYDIDPTSGRITFLNRQPTYGGSPCHVSVDRTGKLVFVANYSGGSVAVFPILENGMIGEPAGIMKHEGGSVHPQRQSAPHVHSVLPDPSNRYAIAADLGTDRLLAYEIDLKGSGLVRKSETTLSPGSGPRHFVFHPNHNMVYLINELDSTIAALSYDPENGTFRTIQTESALPSDFNGISTCADIHLSPDGRFLYGSNRGANSIAVYGVSETDGSLSFVEQVPSGGRTPRNFAVTADGAYLLAANQDSDNICLFRRDRLSGRLKAVGEAASVSRPVCIKMIAFPS